MWRSMQDTILLHPVPGRCNIISFVPLVDSLPACPIQKFISKSIPDVVDHRCASRYDVEYAAILVGCSREFTPGGGSFVGYNTADDVVGPISCLSNANQFSYLVYSQLCLPVLPLDCKVASNGVIPMAPGYVVDSTFKQMAERIISFAETTVSWNGGDIPYNCTKCEMQGRRCAFSTQRNQTFCESSQPHGIFIANWPYSTTFDSSIFAVKLFHKIVLRTIWVQLQRTLCHSSHSSRQNFTKISKQKGNCVCSSSSSQTP